MKKLLGFISFLLVLAGSVSAKVVLPAIFSDNMVLQQNAQVNLWGKATPGERVSVKTSWTDKAVTTKAVADGKWTVKLKTPAAAKGQSVTVSGENSITINNVLTRKCGNASRCSDRRSLVLRWSIQYGISGFQASR